MGNLLGAKYFKRYWPVDGSYWNGSHIDKNCEEDLKCVIRKANEYTRIHVQSLCIIFFMFLSGYFLVDSDKFDLRVLLFVLLPMELYAFMIHHYNRILAKNKLSEIKLDVNLEG
jgi:hypothetical protein